MSIWDALVYLNSLSIFPYPNATTYTILGVLWIPATIAFTLIAFRAFRFETDYGLIQSLLIVTLAFLIFRARVTEQYAIYFFALAVIDVTVWNPKRKQLLLLAMAVALAYLVTNNYFLIQFLYPVYPNSTQIELAISEKIGPIRDALIFLFGTTFTLTNIAYLIQILTQRRHR